MILQMPNGVCVDKITNRIVKRAFTMLRRVSTLTPSKQPAARRATRPSVAVSQNANLRIGTLERRDRLHLNQKGFLHQAIDDQQRVGRIDAERKQAGKLAQ